METKEYALPKRRVYACIICSSDPLLPPSLYTTFVMASIPILRLQYNPNPDQSMKGDDILGFMFSEDGTEQDALLIGEGKYRSSFETRVVEKGYDDLKRKIYSHPVSMEFVATILTLEGNQHLAAKIRQLRQRLASQDKRVMQENLLFLGTVGQPQNPFEYLEDYSDPFLPNLVAVNVVFQSGFQSWIVTIQVS